MLNLSKSRKRIRNGQNNNARRMPMQNCIDYIISSKNINAELIRQEVSFLQETLDNLRNRGIISNDSYLDAGAIEGGLGMLANLIELGIPIEEVHEHLRQLRERASRIDGAHPSLGPAVAASR